MKNGCRLQSMLCKFRTRDEASSVCDRNGSTHILAIWIFMIVSGELRREEGSGRKN